MKTTRTRSILLRFDTSNTREAAFVAAYDQIQKADMSRRFKASIIRESFGVSLLELARQTEIGVVEPLPMITPVLKPIIQLKSESPIDPPVNLPQRVAHEEWGATIPEPVTLIDPPVTAPEPVAPAATPVAEHQSESPVAQPKLVVPLDVQEIKLLAGHEEDIFDAIKSIDQRVLSGVGSVEERRSTLAERDRILKNLAKRVTTRVNTEAAGHGFSADEDKVLAEISRRLQEGEEPGDEAPSQNAEAPKPVDADDPKQPKIRRLMW